MAGGKTELLFSGQALSNAYVYNKKETLGYGVVSIVGIIMKEFEVKQYGGKLHIFSDGWYSTTRDPDTVRREVMTCPYCGALVTVGTGGNWWCAYCKSGRRL